MTPSPATRDAARQSLLDRFDASATPGRIRLRDAGGNTMATIVLRSPAGTIAATGITLALTEYVQVLQTGDVVSAIGETGDGAWVADFTVGLATDVPAPDLPLAALRLYAGSFVRLSAEIDCY